jgi:hypothetical protein
LMGRTLFPHTTAPILLICIRGSPSLSTGRSALPNSIYRLTSLHSIEVSS